MPTSISKPIPENDPQQSAPPLLVSQMLRGLPKPLQQRAYCFQRALHGRCLGMQGGDRQSPWLVCRAIPCHNNGRLVVASVCRLGIARRVYSDYCRAALET